LKGFSVCSQPGQTSTSDIQKRDLRAELLAAEEEARNRKRKADGKAPLIAEADEEVMKRRKLLQQALDLDKDDDEDAASGDEKQKQRTEQDDTDGAPNPEGSSKGRDLDNDDDDDDDDEDDDDDGTAELLRELDKIKRERAEEKARQDAEQSAEREAEIASANPLLNLAAALGQQTPRGVNTTVPGTFAVKKRWDDGEPSIKVISFLRLCSRSHVPQI